MTLPPPSKGQVDWTLEGDNWIAQCMLTGTPHTKGPLAGREVVQPVPDFCFLHSLKDLLGYRQRLGDLPDCRINFCDN